MENKHLLHEIFLEKLKNAAKKKLKFESKDDWSLQSRIAEALGIPTNVVNGWFKKSFPNPIYLMKIKDILEITPNELFWIEKDQKESKDEKLSLVHGRQIAYELQKEFVTIPQVSSKISAGIGLISNNAIEIRIAFRREWIQRKGLPENMSFIQVDGHSMEPTIHHGDIVLIDHSRNYIDSNGGIYAIVMQNEIKIKRLQKIYSSKKIRIISDNPKYPPDEVDPEDLIINGKAIWFGRELKE